MTELQAGYKDLSEDSKITLEHLGIYPYTMTGHGVLIALVNIAKRIEKLESLLEKEDK